MNLFQKNLHNYTKSRTEWLTNQGDSPFYYIENLEGKLTDQMSQKHRDSDKIVFVSHPGWNSRHSFRGFDHFRNRHQLPDSTKPLTQRRKLDLIKWNYLGTNDLHLLREELMLEDLINHFHKKDIPIVLTIPSYLSSPLSDPKIEESYFKSIKKQHKQGVSQSDVVLGMLSAPEMQNQIWAEDNQVSFYVEYLNKLIMGKDNIYLLPTEGGSGFLLDDVFSKNVIGTLFDQSIDHTKKQIRFELIDGKPNFRLLNEDEPFYLETQFPYGFDFNLDSILSHSISEKDYKELVTFCGEDFIKDVIKRYEINLKHVCKDRSRLLSQDALIAPLIEPIFNNSWENIYLAGGQLGACLSQLTDYFTLLDNPNMVILSHYCDLRHSNPESIGRPSLDKHEIQYYMDGLMSSNSHRKIKKELFQKLANQFDMDVVEKEVSRIYHGLNYLNKFANPESKFDLSFTLSQVN